MMQSELLYPTLLAVIRTDPCYGMLWNQEMDFFYVDDQEFSSPFGFTEESPVISSNTHRPSVFMGELFHLSNGYGIIQSVEGSVTISRGEVQEIRGWMNEHDDGFLTSSSTMEGDQELSARASMACGEKLVVDMPIDFPWEKPESDNQLSLLHLLRAYGEAAENGEKDLAEVIAKSINEKSNATGNTMERVAFNLLHSKEDQGAYLRLESIQNLTTARTVFYLSLPLARFAHLAANTVILEAMPKDAATQHVVDFDIGEGIQWPSLIEDLSRNKKMLRISAIKLEEHCTETCRDFEETKRRLQNHARHCGLKLKIEEKSMQDLVLELTRMDERGERREWLAFNCMMQSPRTTGRQRRTHILEFLKVALESLTNTAGVLVRGDGETHSFNTCSSFKDFFDKLLSQYHALFEALERNFPTHLAEARTAMETLFFGPYMNTQDWFEEWGEIRKGSELQPDIKLEGRRLSQECLSEAKGLVCEREDSFTVKTEGLKENEMVLEWKGTQLVRFSAWTSRQWKPEYIAAM